MRLIIALLCALFAPAVLAQDMVVITPSGVLTNPTTIPGAPYCAVTEDGMGVNTVTPGADWDTSKGDVPFEIHSDTAGFALYVNQDNVGANDKNSYGIYVDSESQYDPPVYMNMNDGKAITQLGHYSSNIGTNWMFRDVDASVSNVPVVFIEQDNAGDDQPTLRIQQDGTGDYIQADSKFTVKKSGAVLTSDTFYFKYASPGGSPLCWSNSGAYTGHMFVRPCSGSVALNTDKLCIGNTCVTETVLKALLVGRPEVVTASAVE